jgi:chorismate mutase
MATINQLRDEVDILDNQIIYLISKRMKIVKEIAHEKKKIGYPLIDEKREEQMRKNWLCKAQFFKMEYKPIQIILREILQMSKKTQHKLIR